MHQPSFLGSNTGHKKHFLHRICYRVQKMNKNVGFQKQKLEAEGYTSFIDVRYPDEIETKL